MVKKKAETTFPDPEASNIEGLGGMSRSGGGNDATAGDRDFGFLIPIAYFC